MKRAVAIGLMSVVLIAVAPVSVEAGSISFDAGLTPPEDRWIVRTQVRYMSRGNDPTSSNREMSAFVFPTVVAYGLRSDLTLLVRQNVRTQELSTPGFSNRTTGLDDLFLLGKHRLYRRNTPNYTLGLAATLGLECPTGHDALSSETWDLQPGLYLSWRHGPWASDFGAAYTWNGFADRGRDGVNPGDELSLDWALAYQFSLGQEGRASLAPVMEVSYTDIARDRLGGQAQPNTGESVLYVSPGLKLTISSFILEALLRIPVWQEQEGTQLERGLGLIVGARVLF
jgi:hypothetical protein